MQTDIRQLKKQIVDLQAEVEAWKGIVAEMREALLEEVPEYIIDGLTVTEARILSILIKKRSAKKEQLWQLIYGDRISADQPHLNIINVMICHMRQKLSPFGAKIFHAPARGYWISPEHVALLKAGNAQVQQ